MRALSASASVTELAYDKVRLAILSGLLKPGSKLRIGDLCEGFALNLSAVREALQRLNSDGLVIAEPQRGFRVAPISKAELLDLTRVRIEIEMLCLRNAMENGDINWESQILSSAHALRATEVPEVLTDFEGFAAFGVRHEAFHEALCSGCDSPWLLRLRQKLYVQSERYRRMSNTARAPKRRLKDEHDDLAEAVLARDPYRTSKLIESHFNMTTQLLLQTIAPEDLETV